MEHPGFFERAGPFSLRTIAEVTGSELVEGSDPDLEIKDVKPLDGAVEGDLSFVDNPKYVPLLLKTGASACLVPPKFAAKVPAGSARLDTDSAAV